MSTIIQHMSYDEFTLLTVPRDGRLVSGMKTGEALAKAESWWQRLGRKMMIDMKQKQVAKGVGQFVSDNPDNKSFLPSGILNGLPWGELTDREKVKVTLQWHESHVKIPDMTNIKTADYVIGKGYQEYDENDQ